MRRWGSSLGGLHHAPSQASNTALKITFVGPLGDAHSLADELIVSPPPAPAHASAAAAGAAKATALTWRGRRTSPGAKAMSSPHMLRPHGALKVPLHPPDSSNAHPPV